MDDRTMLIIVGELLEHPDEYPPPSPEVLRELLTRLHQLLEREETAQQRRGRPKGDDTGELVATLNQIYTAAGRTVPLAKAKREAAKRKKKSVRTVARAYERFLKERQK